MNFLELGLSQQTVKAVNEWGIKRPTTVQTDVIPAILQGKDIFTIAPGGCGKTISYVLPLVDIINSGKTLSILIITSDSEKSVMISDNLADLNRFHEETRTEDDNSAETDVIIGTPDLLLELAKEEQIDLSKVNILIVDDINLIKKNKQIESMEKVLEMLPADKQNIIYTNRRSRETQDILDKILKAPQEIKVDRTKEMEAETIAEHPIAVQESPTPVAQTSNEKPNPHRHQRGREREKTRPTGVRPSPKFDDEAIHLVKKNNSFHGKTPNFLLYKVVLAQDE